jgi:hypothetical protein
MNHFGDVFFLPGDVSDDTESTLVSLDELVKRINYIFIVMAESFMLRVRVGFPVLNVRRVSGVEYLFN